MKSRSSILLLNFSAVIFLVFLQYFQNQKFAEERIKSFENTTDALKTLARNYIYSNQEVCNQSFWAKNFNCR